MNNLSKVLNEKGVKKSWLATQIGVSNATMTAICKRDKLPMTKALAIAKVLGVEVSKLIGNEK